MSFATSPGPSRPVLQRRRRGPLVPTLIVLAGLAVVLGLLAEVWTEVLWFRQLGFGEVFRTRLVTQALLFVVGGGLMAAAVGASITWAYRSRPVYAPVDVEQQNLDRYRESLEPLRRLVMVVLPLGLGLFAGSAAAQQWQTTLMWLNRTPFGTRDPEFGMDLSFFVFTLPFLRFVVGFLTAVFLLALLAGAATHYLYGGIRLQGSGPRTTNAARVHLAGLVGLLVLLQAGAYWLDRYSALTEENDRFTGAGYTGINAVLPAKSILAAIAVLVAVLFFVAAARRGGTWRLPAIGVALLVVSAVVVGGIYPALVQRFQVTPSQLTREAEYIQRNIDATRTAYGIDDVEVSQYAAAATGERGALREDAQTAASIRLLDPALVSPTFRQLERNKQYYTFADPLDVDRYEIDGEVRDTVIAVRELDLSGLPDNQRSWFNDHAVYTHGFGVVAAYGNQRNDDGEPAFMQQGIPSTGVLGEYEPRIYFGEKSPDFSIVGAPEGAAPRELDFPTDEGDGTGQANTTFSGDGGPSVGNLFNRLLYAIKFRDQNILLSDAVNAESQILYDRAPRDRVEKVAPFLTLDGDPYPAVVDGRVTWIVDAYTVTDAYPYADTQPLGDVTVDSLTQTSSSVVALQQREINYIRNSVKATVDAYSGEVTLYAWDDEDPLLQTWMKIFPGAVQPLSEIDGELMGHLRYPEDLFKVQRTVLGQYHVTDAEAFYSGQDYWQVPADPTAPTDQGEAQPPYYLTLQMPGQDDPSFSLTSAYIPRATQGNVSNVLTGFVAVDADAGDAGGEKAEGYGKIRLLQLPRGEVVPGPGQVQNDFNANPTVSNELNILARGDSEVRRGNLLTLPVGGGLLYVQPVYVQSAGETSYPKLQRVLVSFGEQIGFAETLDAALDQVFGGDSGATAGDAGAGDPSDVPTDPTDPDAGPSAPAQAEVRLQQALTAANQAIQDGQAALAEQDFTAYGEAQQRLQRAIEDALNAEAEIRGAAPPVTDEEATTEEAPEDTAAP
ncbi:UPF0182 family membrane protein [Thalassiella azotivora]